MNLLTSTPRPLYLAAALVLGTLCNPAWAVKDAVVEQAASHLRANDAPAAFALLDPLEQERAGDVDYDLALGAAANQTGHYTRAILALERVVEVDPSNARAKAELGNAYYAVRDLKGARKMLQAAKEQGVPPEVALNIDQFMRTLDRMDLIKPDSRFSSRAYVGFGLGHDSNATSGPVDDKIPVFIFGQILNMTPSTIAAPSSFYDLSAGVSGRYLIDGQWSWVGSADYSSHSNTRDIAKPLNSQNIALATGPVLRKERHEFSLVGQLNQQWQSGSQSAQTQGLIGSWVYRFDGFRQVSTYAQYARSSYDNNPNADSSRSAVGTTYSHAARNGLFSFVGVYAGEDNPRNKAPQFKHVGYQLWGVRTGLQYKVRPNLAAFASLNYEDRRFNDLYPTPPTPAPVTRHDKQSSLELGLNWMATPKWRITPAVSWNHGGSNLPLFRNQRNSVAVHARYEY